GNIRQLRHAAARRPVRPTRDAGRRSKAARPNDLGGTAATTRADLAVAAGAGRDPARRLLEAFGVDDVVHNQRTEPAAPALARAGHGLRADGWRANAAPTRRLR